MSKKLRQLATKGPQQIVGTINAYCAVLAEESGFPAVYLSGSGVAACAGLPDLGVNTMEAIASEAGRIADAVSIPLLVDADTGFGNSLNVSRTSRTLNKAGAAGMHLEDQVADKRCGHRPNKKLCSKEEMSDRIKAACDGRIDDSFVIMARTDALASENIRGAIDRTQAYKKAGADMLFLEGVTDLSHYTQISQIGLPVLANITEFGMTPLYTLEELATNQVALVLYPLTAFRVMMKSALKAYQTLRRDGSQSNLIELMQTREELYEYLDYHPIEKKMDRKLAGN